MKDNADFDIIATKEFVTDIVKQCVKDNIKVIVEGKAKTFCITAKDVCLDQAKFDARSVYWCGAGMKAEDGHRLCGNHSVLSYPAIPEVKCSCNLKSNQYNSIKKTGYEQFCIYMLNQLAVISELNLGPVSWHNCSAILAKGKRNHVHHTNPQESNTQSTQTTTTNSYPTDAQIRAKEIKKKKEASMTDEEKKVSRKKKIQKQEDHHDDCGSDFDLIDDKKESLFCLKHAESEADVIDAYFIGQTSIADHYEDYNDLFDEEFHLSYMHGSEIEEDLQKQSMWSRRAKDAKHVPLSQVSVFLSQSQCAGVIDVMEICGGEGGVSKVCIRRKLKTGKNFDLISGHDLTTKASQEALYHYIQQHKPAVIIMGPLCTAFGGWSRLTRYTNPEGFWQKRRIGEKLANLCAPIAAYQIDHGRHFVCENPAGSELFE